MSTSSPGSIVLLTTAFDVGGAERVLIHAAAGLRARGWRVTVAAFERRSGQVADELHALGVETVDLGVSRHAAFLAVPAVVALLRRTEADVIYTFLIHAHLVGRVAGRMAGVPVILSSQQVMAWEGRAAETLNRWTARWCTRVVAVSNRVADYVVDDVGVPRDHVVTIPNCVDATRFAMPLPDFTTPPVLASIARLSPEKDHTTLLQAFVRIKAELASARLLLAGQGPERPRLEQLARDLGVQDAVAFLGHVVDVREVQRQAHVIIQSSHVEGLPVAVLEAMAAGRPVVAATVGGNDEVILDGTTGHLVAPRSPDALAAAVLDILRDPERARAMAVAGRAHIDAHYTAQAMAQRTHELLVELTGPAANHA